MSIIGRLPISAGPRSGVSLVLSGFLGLLGFSLLVLLYQAFSASVVLVAGVVLLGAIPLLLRPELATLLTVFLLYINFPAILTKQHGIPGTVAGSFTLLLGIPLVSFLIIQRRPARADTTFYLMLLLLAALLASSLVAVSVEIALGRIIEYVAEGILLFWLFINVIRSMPTLRRTIWTLLVAGGLLGALSSYQQVTGSYGQEFGGLAYRNYEAPEGERIRDGTGRRRIWDRAQGPVNEPNRFAQILIVLLPLSLFMHRTARSPAAGVWALGLGVLILAGIVLTMSRGAYVALVLMALAMMAFRWIRSSRLLICTLLLAITIPSLPFVSARITSISNVSSLVGGDAADSHGAVDGAVLGRMTLMLSAWRVFLDHPVIGVGPGQFPPFYSLEYGHQPGIKFRTMPDGAWRAHSLYLEIAAETGVIGLTIFLALVGLLVQKLWSTRRRWLHQCSESSDLATALCLSLVAYLWTGIFLHLEYERYFWFLLALASAALHILQAKHSLAASGNGQIQRAGSVRAVASHLPAGR